MLGALGVSAATVGALAATGLLDRRGRGVAFRHEIARSAVLGAVAPGAEPALHATMIDALERIGGDASVLAHHAAAARRRRADPALRRRGGRRGRPRPVRTARPSRSTSSPCAHVGATPPPAADLLEALSVELYLTDRLDDAIAARARAVELRGDLADAVAVGAGHTAISGFAWYAADRGDRRAARRRPRIAILSDTDDARALGFALANHAFLAAQRGDMAEARAAGTRALRIADELGGDPILRGARDDRGRGRPAARRRRQRPAPTSWRPGTRACGSGHDDLATTPMSNLCHLDVEQGRFDEAEESIAYALRISEERDTPICTMWQLGVRARLRLLQGRLAGGRAGRPRRARRRAKFPLGRLWPHLVLGLLVARRDAPPENPHLDELWRLVDRLDNPGKIAPAAAALAEQAWILRRPDPRLADPRVAALLDRACAGRPGPARCGGGRAGWPRAGVQELGPGRRRARSAAPARPYEQALAQWDDGSADDLLAALPLLDDLGARAVAALFRGRLRELGVTQHPARPVAGHAREPGRAHRAPARRAGPARGRAHQRRDRRAAGDLPAQSPAKKVPSKTATIGFTYA